MKIAVAGKGGVGKTTLSGVLARLFARDGFEVLAVDADPAMSLAGALGIEHPPPPLTSFQELIRERAECGDGVFRLNPRVDDIVERFGATGPDNVKLLVMGTVSQGGSGCMCPASAFLRALMRHIVLKEKSMVILDMEAGIEHLGRSTTRGIDLMLIVAEPGVRSIETARRIHRLAGEIGIKKFGLVVNKVQSENEITTLPDIPLVGVIPFDPEIRRADLTGTPPVETRGAGVEEIKKIKDSLLSRLAQ